MDRELLATIAVGLGAVAAILELCLAALQLRRERRGGGEGATGGTQPDDAGGGTGSYLLSVTARMDSAALPPRGYDTRTFPAHRSDIWR